MFDAFKRIWKKDLSIGKAILFIIAGLLISCVGAIIIESSTGYYYLSHKSSEYYAAFNQSGLSSGQWGAFLFGALVNVFGMIVAYVSLSGSNRT